MIAAPGRCSYAFNKIGSQRKARHEKRDSSWRRNLQQRGKSIQEIAAQHRCTVNHAHDLGSRYAVLILNRGEQRGSRIFHMHEIPIIVSLTQNGEPAFAYFMDHRSCMPGILVIKQAKTK